MTGVAKRLDRGAIENPAALAAAYNTLLDNPEYRGAVERATADEESVKARLDKAEAAFADVP